MSDAHSSSGGPVEVHPAEVAERHRRRQLQLVDVREPYEWEAGRIAGARHVALEHLLPAADTLDRHRPVVLYCRVGARSWLAATALRRSGYDAYSMSGGAPPRPQEGPPPQP